MDHADLLDRLLVWATLRGSAAGRTIVVVDHGAAESAHLLGRRHRHLDAQKQAMTTNYYGEPMLCVTFAGPTKKADDVIARDVRWLLSSATPVNHVVVVTADRELMWRCRSAVDLLEKEVDDADLSGNGNDFADISGLGKKLVGFYKRRESGRVRALKGKARKNKSRASRQKEMERLHREQNHVEGGADLEGTESIHALKHKDSTDEAIGKEEIKLDAERKSDDDATVEVITPQRFLEDLEEGLREWLQLNQQQYESSLIGDFSILSNNLPIPTPISTIQTLFELRGHILSIENALRKKCSLHKRHSLTGELRKCKDEWTETIASIVSSNDNCHTASDGFRALASSLAWTLSSEFSFLDEMNHDGEDDSSSTATPLLMPLPHTSVQHATQSTTSWNILSTKEQEALLLQWGKRRGRSGTAKREKTHDRIVLAERLRRQLELVLEPTTNLDITSAGSSDETLSSNGKRFDREDHVLSLVELYARYIKSRLKT